jgi:dihydropyrimidinase
MKLDLVVRDGLVVTEDKAARRDVGIRDGQFVAVEERIDAETSEMIDATGLMVLPGGVDTHVHIDQQNPGNPMCDDFSSASASAAAGGTTTVISFAWQWAGQSLISICDDYERRARSCHVDYAFHITITDPTVTALDHELPALAERGYRSVKIFMTSEAGLDDGQILRVLEASRRAGALVCVHAENDALIAYMTDKLRRAGLTDTRYFPFSKPILAEREAVHRVITFCEALDVPVEIFHISGASPAEEIERAQRRGVKVWAETCPQYLVLAASDLNKPGLEAAKFVFGPPARSTSDQAALWDYIRRGVISVISSDHSPVRFEGAPGKKPAGDRTTFYQIPNGIPGLAARLPLVFSEGVSKGRITLERFVDLVSTAPAKLFGLYPQKGAIRPGSDADFVLWDTSRRLRLTNSLMHHAADYTPYEGIGVTGYPIATYLRGRAIFENGTFNATNAGRYVKRRAYPQIAPSGRFATPFDPMQGTAS